MVRFGNRSTCVSKSSEKEIETVERARAKNEKEFGAGAIMFPPFLQEIDGLREWKEVKSEEWGSAEENLESAMLDKEFAEEKAEQLQTQVEDLQIKCEELEVGGVMRVENSYHIHMDMTIVTRFMRE